MSMIAAALDAVPKLSALLIDLIERVKDRQTAALVQQIQSLHQTVIGANSELLSENAKLKAENAELKKQPAKLTAPADPCPYCRRQTGELIDLKPHRQKDLSEIGVKEAFYRCSNCGKEYDKEIEP